MKLVPIWQQNDCFLNLDIVCLKEIYKNQLKSLRFLAHQYNANQPFPFEGYRNNFSIAQLNEFLKNIHHLRFNVTVGI